MSLSSSRGAETSRISEFAVSAATEPQLEAELGAPGAALDGRDHAGRLARAEELGKQIEQELRRTLPNEPGPGAGSS